MLLCKIVAMVILHPFLSSGHIMPNEVLKVRKIVNFQIFKIYVAMQNGCYGDFAPILEFRTYIAKCGKSRELFKMIYLHLTKGKQE